MAGRNFSELKTRLVRNYGMFWSLQKWSFPCIAQPIKKARKHFTWSSCFWILLCCSVTNFSFSASASGNSRPAFLAVLCFAHRALRDLRWTPICSSKTFNCICRSCCVCKSHSSYWRWSASSAEKQQLSFVHRIFPWNGTVYILFGLHTTEFEMDIYSTVQKCCMEFNWLS